MPSDYTFWSLMAEDARPELGNKFTIVGLYTGDVLVQSFPATIRIATLTVFHFDKPGRHTLDMRFMLGSDKIAGGPTIDLTAEPDEAVSVNTPATMLNIVAPAELRVEGAIDGGAFQTLVRREIRLADAKLFPPALGGGSPSNR